MQYQARGGENIEMAASELMDEGIDSISFAKIDAHSFPEIKKKFSIAQFPTISMWRNGEPAPFRGDSRSAYGIATYLKRLAGPTSRRLESAEELDTVLRGAYDTVAVGIFADFKRPSHNNWIKQSKELRDEGVHMPPPPPPPSPRPLLTAYSNTA